MFALLRRYHISSWTESWQPRVGVVVNVMLFGGWCLSNLQAACLLPLRVCEHFLDRLLKLTRICSTVPLPVSDLYVVCVCYVEE